MRKEIRDLTYDEFRSLRELIQTKTGIFIDDGKFYFLESKVKQRMYELGLKDPAVYVDIVSRGFYEFQKLINEITISETKFFRDAKQLELALDNIPYSKIKIWSAGCSTGEEAYTLAILALEKGKDPKVLGSDIDTDALQRAKESVYSFDSVRDIPLSILTKYFEFDKVRNVWGVKGFLREKVIFKQINLADSFAMRAEIGYDFVVCRNVFIYLDEKTRRRVVESFWLSLRDGGCLVLGPSERLSSTTAAFEIKFSEGFFFYIK